MIVKLVKALFALNCRSCHYEQSNKLLQDHIYMFHDGMEQAQRLKNTYIFLNIIYFFILI